MEDPKLKKARIQHRTWRKRPICPCCKKYVLEGVGKYEICPICGWEDDPVSREDIEFEGGANQISLKEARERYSERCKEEQ